MRTTHTFAYVEKNYETFQNSICCSGNISIKKIQNSIREWVGKFYTSIGRTYDTDQEKGLVRECNKHEVPYNFPREGKREQIEPVVLQHVILSCFRHFKWHVILYTLCEGTKSVPFLDSLISNFSFLFSTFSFFWARMRAIIVRVFPKPMSSAGKRHTEL